MQHILSNELMVLFSTIGNFGLSMQHILSNELMVLFSTIGAIPCLEGSHAQQITDTHRNPAGQQDHYLNDP